MTIINHRSEKASRFYFVTLCKRRQTRRCPRSGGAVTKKTMKMKIFAAVYVGDQTGRRRNPGTKRPGPCSCSEDVNLCRIHQETNSVSPKDTVTKLFTLIHFVSLSIQEFEGLCTAIIRWIYLLYLIWKLCI